MSERMMLLTVWLALTAMLLLAVVYVPSPRAWLAGVRRRAKDHTPTGDNQ